MFLLDTNVISELRRVGDGRCNPGVTRWVASVDPDVTFITAITILELEIGVLRLDRRDPAQGRLLRNWMDDQVLPAFAGRILAFDEVAARHAARLHVPDPKSERDAMIAGIARAHVLTIVTRNIRDFAGPGLKVLNPWDS